MARPGGRSEPHLENTCLNLEFLTRHKPICATMEVSQSSIVGHINKRYFTISAVSKKGADLCLKFVVCF